MARKQELLTDEQVEQEIQRLWQTEAVRLAKKEQNLKYRRRQYLSVLRNMEKRGNELLAQGINTKNIRERLFPELEE